METLRAERDTSAQQLEEAQAQLLEIEERLPVYEEARQQARQNMQEAEQLVGRLEARLEALERLQADVLQNSELKPWLKKHGLADLSHLWQKIQIEAGWDVALESVLRERLNALEVTSLEEILLLAEEVPPTRLVLYQKPNLLAVNESKPGLKSLLSLLRCPVPDL